MISALTDDRIALLHLRASIGGRTLRWNTAGNTPCSWEGVKCDNITNRVIALRLPGSGLIGRLPSNTIGNLTELRVLSLRYNALSGPIPSDISSCSQLTDIHLQGNSFSGEVPESFFALNNLLRVNLASNKFSGDLPFGFNSLAKIRTLYLENNQFTGSLPDLLCLSNLRQFNVSFNGLIGLIPRSLQKFSAQSFLGTSLCGGALVSCTKNKISSEAEAGIAIGSAFGFVLILLFSLFLRRKYKSRKTIPRIPPSPVKPIWAHEPWNPKSIAVNREENRSNSIVFGRSPSNEKWKFVMKNGGHDGFVFFHDDEKSFNLQDLFRSSAEILGKGSLGSTYKAYLDSGFQVIVKRLKNVIVSEKEFRSKMEEVGSLTHENLLPVEGYYYAREEKLVIYEPMSHGSLYSLLHGAKKQPLCWEVRLKIALGTARGIEHLHSNSPRTVHGNIKASNIFLTNYYNPRVTEFGLTQLVPSASTTNGYRAPEVTDARNITQPADVYSFGVILLELLTSKSPDEEGIKLADWVESVVKDKWTIQVFDPELLRYENLEEQMVPLLHLAISCTSQNPEKRPSIAEIVRRIHEISAGEDQEMMKLTPTRLTSSSL
ncbi:atypical receptor-like kinase 1 [Dorcoceras hygrometricum]|uniref:Atypical receptor-like kinase 1 n=1 Tax=Dorcoceras hygrometricum TaxID=472368 RepID=A0A2Z7CH84_9LAMI|nr:atypical receptor-like kinase 1 [Dorcoceras hygrometricum]